MTKKMKKDTKLFTEEIIKLRKKNNKTIREVADILDLSRTYYGDIERNNSENKILNKENFYKFYKYFCKTETDKKNY